VENLTNKEIELFNNTRKNMQRAKNVLLHYPKNCGNDRIRHQFIYVDFDDELKCWQFYTDKTSEKIIWGNEAEYPISVSH
jgi:hypothetical protein